MRGRRARMPNRDCITQASPSEKPWGSFVRSVSALLTVPALTMVKAEVVWLRWRRVPEKSSKVRRPRSYKARRRRGQAGPGAGGRRQL